jgi:hypothetical protein
VASSEWDDEIAASSFAIYVRRGERDDLSSPVAGGEHLKRVSVEATRGGRYANVLFLRGKQGEKVAVRMSCQRRKQLNKSRHATAEGARTPNHAGIY